MQYNSVWLSVFHKPIRLWILFPNLKQTYRRTNPSLDWHQYRLHHWESKECLILHSNILNSSKLQSKVALTAETLKMLEEPRSSFSSTGPYLTFNFLASVRILLNRLCFFIKVNYIWLQLWAGHCWNPEGLTDCQVEYVCAISKSTESRCIFKAFVMFCFTKSVEVIKLPGL